MRVKSFSFLIYNLVKFSNVEVKFSHKTKINTTRSTDKNLYGTDLLHYLVNRDQDRVLYYNGQWHVLLTLRALFSDSDLAEFFCCQFLLYCVFWISLANAFLYNEFVGLRIHAVRELKYLVDYFCT